MLQTIFKTVHKTMWYPLLFLANTHRSITGEDKWTIEYVMMHPSKRMYVLKEVSFPLMVILICLLAIMLAWESGLALPDPDL